MSELWHLGAAALAQHFAAGRASPVEALEATLERISAVDDKVGAFTTVLEGAARSEARARTEELSIGFCRGPLHGVPVAIKELFDVEGASGDYGSDVLSGRIAEEDAELVKRLRRAGAVIVGTTRSHEFGWGITTQHSDRPGTRNPWDRERVPGGSSGGSAAAVALGMVPVAIGSDTGGSIRIPASFCGVAGLKPTFGRVSRTGGVALAPSFDTPGALGRTMEDVTAVMAAISGPDGADSASPDRPAGPLPSIPGSLHGMRIGTSEALVEIALDADIARVYDSALNLLEELGAELVEIDLPRAESIRAAFVPLQMAEAHHVHHVSLGLFPDRASDYGADVRSRLEAAAEVSVTEYLSAQEQRRQFTAAFDHQLRSIDAIVSPISAVGPSHIDNSDRAICNGKELLLRDAVMGFTVPQNVTGLPASIIRAGFDSDGLPVGIQLTAGRWSEDTAVTIAAALQLATNPAATPIPLQAHK